MRRAAAVTTAALAGLHLACRSASGPVPSLAPRFEYTVHRANGDSLHFTGDLLRWLVSAISGSPNYQLEVLLFPPLQPGDSLFPEPMLVLRGAGTQFRTCPPSGAVGVGADASPPQTTGVQLALAGQITSMADSGRFTFHPLADSVVAGTLDVYFSQPQAGLRVTGTFTAPSYPGVSCPP
jgi:hypothetical protein